MEYICKRCNKEFFPSKTNIRRNIKRGFVTSYCSEACKHFRDELYYFRIVLRDKKQRSHPSTKGKNQPVIDLDALYLKSIWDSQGGICPFTNLPMKFIQKRNRVLDPLQLSLDRIDNALPYQKGNVRFICLFINLARNVFSDEQVNNIIKEIRNAKPGTDCSGLSWCQQILV